MVLHFFRSSSGGNALEHVVARAAAMLGDARHSFDLASLALLAESVPESVTEDVRATDERINAAEHTLRSELIVHVAVRGSTDIGSVLGLTVLLKKIERIGDQAVNILDLAESGVTLAGLPEIARVRADQRAVSTMFGTAGELLRATEHDRVAFEAFEEAGRAFVDAGQERIDGYLRSDRPGHEVVPLALFERYVRRIVANLVGVVRVANEPVAVDDGRPDDRDD